MSALYLYGVTRPRELPARLSERGIFLVESEGRAAIVSELDAAPVQPSRHNLLAHADVVEELHEQSVVLPTRFGTVLDDHAAALELLALPDIEQLLELHRDRSELTLKGTYEESVLEEVSRPLAPLRDAYRQAPTLEGGIALGEAVTEALADRRDRDLARVLERIERHVEDVVVSKPVGEYGALDLALLVRRDAVEALEAALAEATQELSPPLHLRLVGPLPPYSFVSLELPVAA
ncbi:MAG TPA: GvpL/GvpF family gas vesicle protein [Gaiellaceae bacterium]|nr:GvpL/GvpF family gas vesicle protein [Gaiellaceae bacterium]